MKSINQVLISRWGPAVTGAFVGTAASLLVFFGNPGNMGICVACFTRDIAGALGLHRAGVVQYLRPEIPGFILGSFLAAFLSREYQPRSGSSPIVRFFLGFFAMIGALIFLGCPWRAYARLAGGDWNAIAGIGGLAVGIGVGIIFLWNGFSLGRASKSPAWAGIVMPLAAVALLALLFLRPLFGPEGTGPVFFSKSGPGAATAPVFIALGVGLIVGWMAQKSRFCTVGALRDLIMLRDGHLFSGVAAFLVSAFVVNLLLGQFKPGFEGQPVAHMNHLWNFIGMALSGLAFTLAGGCPGRQFIMSGEGDGDASIFVLGMLVGAGFAHNFALASSGAGVTANGMTATVIGLVFCLAVGWLFRIKMD
ncbi:MAG TPA: YedE family putative selenium transporter [Aminivibrio sp.]|uniref:YedE family putative selenium transporter n=1 Tax=Aminivibrio sp. TaxID=1872489 RepID=UPI002C3DAC54|nr:YedE family putative selenium transporter [Aminivibrio sp.]HPF84691.1 YedE family putative selenium transporter [Aminivibrio sp.]